ncbi:MAG: amidohydrolase family protein [Beijerinckiaceae bacterium]
MRPARLLLATTTLFACISAPIARAQYAEAADTIYLGTILTMNDKLPNAEAVAVKAGRILAVGPRDTVTDRHKGGNTRVIDLQDKTLLPGFIDGHSHYFSALSVANQVNVYPPPAGPGKDAASIVAEIVKFRDARKIPEGEIIQAYGYDDTVMAKGELLNRGHLDAAFPKNPVMVNHVSMHGAVLNSAALKKYGITAETKTPPGGVIVRKDGSQEPWGLIMETAYLPVFAALPKPTPQQEIEFTRAAQLLYASNGITTAQEGSTRAGDLAVMQRAANAGANIIDVVSYPFITDLDEVLKTNPVATFGAYKNRLKIGGVKITTDGSPQGRTAFFTKPYLTGGPSGEKDWRGEPTFPEEAAKQMIKKVYDLRVPLIIHANGDAAIDLVLRGHEFAAGNDPTRDRNTTVIHSQFVRKDQLDKYAKYKIRPSFYTLHTYYFADAHIANRGKDQAQFISPMKAALARGIAPTNHTDFVVVPLDQMFMLWSAANRVSRGGEVIGADQRATPLEGLKAMTINGARQYGEDATKGSIEPGKLADFVILDKNPLKVKPMEIKDIKIVETIKEGATIWPAK